MCFALAGALALSACAPRPPEPPAPGLPSLGLPGGARTLVSGIDRTSAAGDLRLVQLDGPVTEADKAALRATGIELRDYVQGFAFVARVPDEALDRLDAMDKVAAVAPMRADDRIPPPLRQTLTATAPEVPLKVRAVLWDEVDPTTLTPRLTALGATVELAVRDRYLSLVELTVPAGLVETIAAWPEVRWLETPVKYKRVNDRAMPTTQSGFIATGSPLFDAGLDGSGQIVTVMDDNLDLEHGMFAHSPTEAGLPGVLHRKVLSYVNFDVVDECAYDHGTHVTGTVAGHAGEIGLNGVADGVARGARIIFHDIGRCSDDILYPPDLMGSVLKEALDAGSHVHTNSWGASDNIYTVDANAFDSFMWSEKSFLVLVAAGNHGDSDATIGAPATAKNIVAVGAHDLEPNVDKMLDFSSRGPALEGTAARRSPTLVAPGRLMSAASDVKDGIDDSISLMIGTSMATPVVAGSAILVRQYFTDGWYPTGAPRPEHGHTPSAALMRGVLMNGTRNLAQARARPSNDQGMGRLVLDDALYLAGDARRLFVDDAGRVATGESLTYELEVTEGESLQILLAWTDRPGSRLVNDLDLTVEHDGQVWLGGVFEDGWAATGGEPDRRHPDEAVFLQAPASGVYRVTVTGFNVPMGEDADGRQPFALVVSGGLSSVDGETFEVDTKLLSPPGFLRTGDATPTLSFEGDASPLGPQRFEVQWSTDPTFATRRSAELVPGGDGPLSFTPQLTDGTWFWRVRQRSENGLYGDFSSSRSLTVQTGRTVDGWYQGTPAQLARNVLEGSATADDRGIAFAPVVAGEFGRVTTPAFESSLGWSELAFTTQEVGEGLQVVARLESLVDGVMSPVPDAVLPGNEAGFSSSPVDLSGLDPTLYTTLRVVVTAIAIVEAPAGGWLTSLSLEPGVDDAPVLIAPEDSTVEATSAAGAEVTWDAPIASDDLGAPGSVSCSPSSGSVFPLGSTSVRCSVADDAGNSTVTSFTVTVVDTTSPHFEHAPADLTLEATSAAGAVAAFEPPTAIDLVSGELNALCVPGPGTVAPLGSTTVACSVTDAAGNEATASFVITVRDTTPPAVARAPTNLSIEATGPEGAMVSFERPTFLDAVDGLVDAHCTPAPGSAFEIGSTTVACVGRDEADNQTEVSFAVEVGDTTPPAVPTLSNLTVVATTEEGATLAWGPVAAGDLVDGSREATCTPASGSLFKLGDTTVTCTAADARGNQASTAFTVTVRSPEDTGCGCSSGGAGAVTWLFALAIWARRRRRVPADA